MQEHSIHVQKIPASSASVQFHLAFSTVQWSKFDDLLLAFACLYHSPRLRQAVAEKPEASVLLTGVHEESVSVHQDFVKLLEEHAGAIITCSRASIPPQVCASSFAKRCRNEGYHQGDLVMNRCRRCCVSLCLRLPGKQLAAIAKQRAGSRKAWQHSSGR